MRDNTINNLTRELERVRLNRDNVIQRLAQHVEHAQINKLNIVNRLNKARREANATANRNPNNVAIHRNTFQIGELVCITNTLRNKYGTTGVVQSSGQ